MASVAPGGVGQAREKLAFTLGQARGENPRFPGSCPREMTLRSDPMASCPGTRGPLPPESPDYFQRNGWVTSAE